MSDEWKNLVEASALFAAAVYFAYKLYDGWGLVNLSIELDADRKSTTDFDRIAVRMKLSKGDRGSLELHAAELRCIPAGSTPRDVCLNSIYPLKRIPEGMIQDGGSRVYWDSIDRGRPSLHLPPGESTQYSWIFDVPGGAPCIIEAVVIAKRPSSTRYGQWRASVAVL